MSTANELKSKIDHPLNAAGNLLFHSQIYFYRCSFEMEHTVLSKLLTDIKIINLTIFYVCHCHCHILCLNKV